MALRPQPLKLKKKPRGLRIKDLEPSDPSFKPADLNTCKCPGLLYGDSVLVTEAQHIWALVKLGSYGKGVFSRSVPCHHHTPSLEELRHGGRKRGWPAVNSEEIERTWKKRIKLHSQWVGGADEGAETESEAVLSKSEPVLTVGGVAEPDDSEKSYQDFVERIHRIKEDDPWHLEEYLQLGAEEAFYLMAEVKVLNVQLSRDTIITPSNLWQHFSLANKSFPARYAAYAYYRAGNWVPKSGLKFGVDFLLYKDGPLSYHSSYAVVVKEESSVEAQQQNLTWKEVIAFNRVSESAGKDLLICHVSTAGRGTGEDSKEAWCMESTFVKDTVIKRWVPEKDRET